MYSEYQSISRVIKKKKKKKKKKTLLKMLNNSQLVDRPVLSKSPIESVQDRMYLAGWT